MSHFEPTCQLTGLPILNDDPVLVLPVVHQYDDNHMDCPDDRAVPLLLPVAGVWRGSRAVLSPLPVYTKAILANTPFYDLNSPNTKLKPDEHLTVIQKGMTTVIGKPLPAPNDTLRKRVSCCYFHKEPAEQLIQWVKERQTETSTYCQELNVPQMIKKQKINVRQIKDADKYNIPINPHPPVYRPGKVYHLAMHYQMNLKETWVEPYIKDLADLLYLYTGLAELRRGFFGFSGNHTVYRNLTWHQKLAAWVQTYCETHPLEDPRNDK